MVKKKCSKSGTELQECKKTKGSKCSKAGKSLQKCKLVKKKSIKVSKSNIKKVKKMAAAANAKKKSIKVSKSNMEKVKKMAAAANAKKKKKLTTYYIRFRTRSLTQMGRGKMNASRSEKNQDRVVRQMKMKMHSWGSRWDTPPEKWVLYTFKSDKKKVEDWEKSFSIRNWSDLKNETELYTMTGEKKNYIWKKRLTDKEYKRLYIDP